MTISKNKPLAQWILQQLLTSVPIELKIAHLTNGFLLLIHLYKSVYVAY